MTNTVEKVQQRMADLLKDTELRKLDKETTRGTNGWTDRQASRQAGRQTFKLNMQFSKMCIPYGGENPICFFDQSFPHLLQTQFPIALPLNVWRLIRHHFKTDFLTSA